MIDAGLTIPIHALHEWFAISRGRRESRVRVIVGEVP